MPSSLPTLDLDPLLLTKGDPAVVVQALLSIWFLVASCAPEDAQTIS